MADSEVTTTTTATATATATASENVVAEVNTTNITTLRMSNENKSIFGKYKCNSVTRNNQKIHVNLTDVDIPTLGYFDGSEYEELSITQSIHELNHQVQEITLTYFKKVLNYTITRTYQLGKWNIERFDGEGRPVVCAIVFAIPPNSTISHHEDIYEEQIKEFSCTSFVIVRYSSAGTFESSEKFVLSNNGESLETIVSYSRGTTVNVHDIKLFSKVSYETKSEKLFSILPKSVGWFNLFLHSAEVLHDVKIKYVDSFSIKGVDYNHLTGLASPNATPSDYKGGSPVLRRIAGKLNDQDDFVLIRIRVTFRDVSWDIVHRFTEFDALRQFISSYASSDVQIKSSFSFNELSVTSNQSTPETGKVSSPKNINVSPTNLNSSAQNVLKEPSFPSKRTLLRGASVSISRGQGLESYLHYHLESVAASNNAILVNVISSFLEVPENLLGKGFPHMSPVQSSVHDAIIAEVPVDATNATSESSSTTAVSSPTPVSRVDILHNVLCQTPLTVGTVKPLETTFVDTNAANATTASVSTSIEQPAHHTSEQETVVSDPTTIVASNAQQNPTDSSTTSVSEPNTNANATTTEAEAEEAAAVITTTKSNEVQAASSASDATHISAPAHPANACCVIQ